MNFVWKENYLATEGTVDQDKLQKNLYLWVNGCDRGPLRPLLEASEAK